ncbi:alcohol dehydrogenase catalytic domain-containing protein [Ktedonobacter robiniae]|uniref:alcohol dehydrogenase catalytic domain-containing protein n=1 Tax=Ktedonobacter robiniae TaxID=2778365 RepID=UPI003B75CBB2
MKAIQIHAYGGPEVLIYEEVPRPIAGSGEVLLRVAAAGVNPSDWKTRRGFADFPESRRPPRPPLPLILGHDVSGIVEAVGPGVTIVPARRCRVWSNAPWRSSCGRDRRLHWGICRIYHDFCHESGPQTSNHRSSPCGSRPNGSAHGLASAL